MILHKQIQLKFNKLGFTLNPKPKQNKTCKQTFANNKRTIQQKQKQNPTNKPKVKQIDLYAKVTIILASTIL
jgi:hypothetical protein